MTVHESVDTEIWYTFVAFSLLLVSLNASKAYSAGLRRVDHRADGYCITKGACSGTTQVSDAQLILHEGRLGDSNVSDKVHLFASQV